MIMHFLQQFVVLQNLPVASLCHFSCLIIAGVEYVIEQFGASSRQIRQLTLLVQLTKFVQRSFILSGLIAEIAVCPIFAQDWI